MNPICTIVIRDYPLRIYASPVDGPDYPWASFQDFAALTLMDDIDRDSWLAVLCRDNPDMIRVLSDGTTIIAEPMVGDLFSRWNSRGSEDAQHLLNLWKEAWAGVFLEQIRHLSGPERRKAFDLARLRNVPMAPGLTVMQ